jgi:hypothetical protein
MEIPGQVLEMANTEHCAVVYVFRHILSDLDHQAALVEQHPRCFFMNGFGQQQHTELSARARRYSRVRSVPFCDLLESGLAMFLAGVALALR